MQLAEGFADYAATKLNDCLAKNSQATLVVPGGNTPRYYLPILAERDVPWDKITITLSDERWVDVNDEASNEHLVKKHLLAHLPTNAKFVGLKTHHDTPDEAVDSIQQRLDQLPQPFGLTVLGLGEDGHIASLFPGMNPEIATPHHCVAVDRPIAPSLRISLSLAALANSQHIALVVVGKAKRLLLDRLSENPDPKIPLVWLLQRRQTPIVVFETDGV
ncbi:MAG: 6-phosphogluconolactonase [Nitrosomonas sp.]|nr:6-phosphogluconolactonase [Nitrosomonas sp.]